MSEQAKMKERAAEKNICVFISDFMIHNKPPSSNTHLLTVDGEGKSTLFTLHPQTVFHHNTQTNNFFSLLHTSQSMA